MIILPGHSEEARLVMRHDTESNYGVLLCQCVRRKCRPMVLHFCRNFRLVPGSGRSGLRPGMVSLRNRNSSLLLPRHMCRKNLDREQRRTAVEKGAIKKGQSSDALTHRNTISDKYRHRHAHMSVRISGLLLLLLIIYLVLNTIGPVWTTVLLACGAHVAVLYLLWRVYLLLLVR